MIGEMLTGGGLTVAGFVLGWLLSRAPRRPRVAADPEPICGCGHHRAMHDPKTNECHGENRQGITSSGNPRMVRCTCRQYVGPEPLPTYLPEIG